MSEYLTKHCFVPSARLLLTKSAVIAYDASDNAIPIPPEHAGVLELFAHHHELTQAYQCYTGLFTDNALHEHVTSQAWPSSDGCSIIVSGSRVVLCSPSLSRETERIINLANKCAIDTSCGSLDRRLRFLGSLDMTHRSRILPVIVLQNALRQGLTVNCERLLELEAFAEVVMTLRGLCLLSIPVGNIDFGDFLESVPFCRQFGYSRGTPVDRYYLGQFMDSCRNFVRGRLLDVGGSKANQSIFGLQEVSEWRVVDLRATADADVQGDVHDEKLFAPALFDCILLLNVLEHCQSPCTVAHNVLRWLKPSGKLLVAVPNAQRVHSGPRDYWRVLPDGLESLLGGFSAREIRTYGNLLAVIASLAGIAAEELTPAILAKTESAYPVLSCAICTK